jgi:hypothetical protein
MTINPGDDQTRSDLDQTSADGDETHSDGDQTGSDRDRDAADRDRLTADLDQAASDRDLASGLGREAYDISRTHATGLDMRAMRRHSNGMTLRLGGTRSRANGISRHRGVGARSGGRGARPRGR